MTIGITGRTTSLTTPKTPTKTEIEGEKKTAIANTEKNDSIALTTATQEMKKTMGSSSASPVDIDRVNAVKKAITDGNHTINAENVAKKMIQFEKLIQQKNSI
ncbi:MAG: Anti-sigma-28 factor, FlgM [Pseudomonadota bacterium]|jgi:negative regulator of flagellin synthesis FlgM